MITYAMYSKEKYNRSGALLEGRYKNVLVDNDSQLLHLTRYIHLNPLKLNKSAGYEPAEKYLYSSYQYYTGRKIRPDWLSIDGIMRFFAYDTSKYKAFVEEKPFNYGKINNDYKLTKHVMID